MPAHEPRSWLIDMDGVIVREEEPIEASAAFLAGLRARGMPFLVLTNNSIYTPSDLAARLRLSGIDVSEDDIWTSALATARFLDDQRPGGSAFTIGEAGLTTALYEVGYVHTEYKPDYVVLGETRTYSIERITKAIRLIEGGARFIATNPDPTGPSPAGSLPATGSVAALISRATGVAPYFVGKPNPLMIRTARRTASTPTPRRPSWSGTAWTPMSSPAWRPGSRPCWSSRACRRPRRRDATRSCRPGWSSRSPTCWPNCRSCPRRPCHRSA